MTQDDFRLITDDDSRIAEIADAAFDAIYAAPQPASEQKNMRPTNGMDRAQFHDKAWALWQEKALGNALLPKLSIHAIRTLWDVLYDSMPASEQQAANSDAPLFDPVIAAAGAVVLHWDEFGHAYGFDESIDRLRYALAAKGDGHVGK